MGKYRRHARLIIDSDSDINLSHTSDYGIHGPIDPVNDEDQVATARHSRVTAKEEVDEARRIIEKMHENERIKGERKFEKKLENLEKRMVKGEITEACFQELKAREIEKHRAILERHDSKCPSDR